MVPTVSGHFFYDNCAKCAILDIYKIDAERSEAGKISSRCLKLSIFRTIFGDWSGPGGPWPLWPPLGPPLNIIVHNLAIL